MLACEADGGRCFLQIRVEGHSLVEHETRAREVLLAADFKVFQDAAFELVHLPKAGLLHIGASLFATNAARAKHDDGFGLDFFRKLIHRAGKVTEVIDSYRHRILERS